MSSRDWKKVIEEKQAAKQAAQGHKENAMARLARERKEETEKTHTKFRALNDVLESIKTQTQGTESKLISTFQSDDQNNIVGLHLGVLGSDSEYRIFSSGPNLRLTKSQRGKLQGAVVNMDFAANDIEDLTPELVEKIFEALLSEKYSPGGVSAD